MTKLALSVAAMLLASSAAFAGSDHFTNTASQPAVDTNATASISTRHDDVDTKVVTGPGTASVKEMNARHNDDGIWGK
jgi:uncharacterized lipoprotein YajG